MSIQLMMDCYDPMMGYSDIIEHENLVEVFPVEWRVLNSILMYNLVSLVFHLQIEI